jgi:hypothetical protein
MLPVLNELLADGQLVFRQVPVFRYTETRPVAIGEPNLTLFSRSDLDYLDRAIAFYWDKTGRETSDSSHGVAWKSRENGEPMPYELSYLSDEPISSNQKRRLLDLAIENRWLSQ